MTYASSATMSVSPRSGDLAMDAGRATAKTYSHGLRPRVNQLADRDHWCKHSCRIFRSSDAYSVLATGLRIGCCEVGELRSWCEALHVRHRRTMEEVEGRDRVKEGA